MNQASIQTLLTAMHQMSGWEIAAALMGVVYILLASKASQWCWLFAFCSTLVYTVLFWNDQLPMQALLNFYYMGMAVYGFWLWHIHGTQTDTLQIRRWPWQWHVAFTVTGVIISTLASIYLQQTGQSQSPILDAYTTVFSVMNTMLIARKVLENWLYWAVIDGAATLLYVQTGYYATAALFVLNTVLAMVGFISWVALYRQRQAAKHL